MGGGGVGVGNGGGGGGVDFAKFGSSVLCSCRLANWLLVFTTNVDFVFTVFVGVLVWERVRLTVFCL